VSRQQLQATRYDVLCEQEFIGKARQLLGLGVWPPPLPTVTPAVDAEAAGSDGPTGG
jgi:hypothetical protein